MNDQYRGAPVGAHEPIAIVGMACHLPGGSRSPEAFFDFLLKRKCGVVEIPADRWDIGPFYDPNKDGIATSVSKWGGFVEGIRLFDAKFFGISPREASAMDPQQRMILQSAVEAMMDAQIPLEEFSRESTGVFVGISQSEYRTLQEMRLTGTESYAGTGYALCVTANRVSHRLNLRGPSYAVDTACSSSLTAVNQAVQNLRAGACDMAIVSGVNALTHPSSFLAFSKAGMISPTGRISTFDASANGFVRAEGVGTVVLKPLSRAQADGDRIHAVIEGTAVNQDGNTSTITAPNQQAQTAMLRQLFRSVDVRPDQIGFVEAHGTGTPIGDPIEAGAIGSVIGQNSPDRPVYVGSSKANVGHLESGAGITGLIKVAMAVKTGIVPPNIHFKNPNPRIPFDALNLEVPVKPETFPEMEGRRYAVVNSFGFGGTNASALVSAPPAASFDHHPVKITRTEPRVELGETGFPYLVPLSGATAEAMQANAGALLKSLGAKGKLANASLSQIAAALATKRSHLMHRAVILARSLTELKSGLRRIASGKTDAPGVFVGQQKPKATVCFTFSGQGSQWWAMARDLLEGNKIFSDAVDAFDKEFIAVAGWSIRAELEKDQSTSNIDDTTVTQPALFAIQTGLAALWKRLGVAPDMVAGHSIGEAAASYVAGGLSLSGAAKFLSKRGAIRDQLGAKGAMAAIGLNHKDIEALLPAHGKLGIAAINGPGSTTISGDYDALHAFVEEFELTHPNTFIRALTVDTAWHSYHLDAGEKWFRREMASIDWSVPKLPFISTVTGRPETRFDTDYGWLNLRRPVRFQAGVEAALDLGADTFIELGPAATLAGPTRSTALERGATVTVLNSVNRKDNDFDAMAEAAAKLFVEGYPLNWEALTDLPAQHVELPQNVWIEEAFWQDSEESRNIFFTEGRHPFLGSRLEGNGTSWYSEINLKAYPYLKDHRMQSDALFPAAGYLDTMIALGRAYFGPDKNIELEDIVIHEALFIQPEQEVLFSNVYDPERGRIHFYSRVRDQEDDWVLRGECRIRVTDVPPSIKRRLDPTSKSFKPVDLDYVYDEGLSAAFINYGEAFQTIEELRMSRNKTWARLVLRDVAKTHNQRHHMHPTLLDGCLQLLDPTMTLKHFEADQRAGEFVTMPIGAGQIRVYGDMPDEVIVEADQFDSVDRESIPVGFKVFDLDGNLLMSVQDLQVKFLPTKQSGTVSEDVPARFVRQDIVDLRLIPEPAAQNGRWVVLESAPGEGAALTKSLKAQGTEVELIHRAELGDDPGGALADLLGEDIESGQIAGILVTWPLSLPHISEKTFTDALYGPLETCAQDMISLGELMDYARSGTNQLPRFVLLTSGAYPDGEGNALDTRILTQMPLATLVRGLATETPEYAFQIIDADQDALAAPDALAAFILSQSNETEIILRNGTWAAPRMSFADEEDFAPKLLKVTEADTTTNFHATMRSPGIIDQVELAERPLDPVGPDQVRVRVSAVGLNFRDVMAVTGLLPTEAEPEPAWENLGLEFGAVVTEVGANVTGFKPGDRVMGMGRRCLQRFLTTDARALTHVPDHISLSQAATIPSAFATAHYALNHIGRMRAGEKVLIHVATGGVGTAAVQLAKAAGAEIFATAGSPEKRKVLRKQGIKHIMDSRSLKFADDVMEITKGAGVDVLLNSLPGDYIAKGLDIMAPYGRFLEIGKRDVYEDSSVGMKALRRNVSLNVLDLAAMGLERPDLMAELFAELSQMLEGEMLSPLPLTEFPISQVRDAIRYMSQAKHVGKVVVTLEEEAFSVRRDEGRPAKLHSDASYLVTGGTAGFGLSMADWLSQAGTGEVILASRSGGVDRSNEKKLAKMRKRGTAVSIVSLDISDADAVDAFVSARQKSDMPIKGVVHGAAVIRDGLANQLTPDMISDVLTPKIKGAWNLHRSFAATGVEPDFMIGFSSVAQVVGSAGQTNYVAANAFLDALAQYRRSIGRPGVAIDWGVIADAGFVARNSALASYLESVGQFGLTIKDAQKAMEVAVTREASTFLFARADWAQICRANPVLGNSPRLSGLVMEEGGATTQVRARLMELEGQELITEAEEYIKDEITNVLKIDKQSIQVERPMSELGLDSLSSFELKVRVETALDMTIPVSKFLQAPSISELAGLLGSELEAAKKSEAAALVAAESADASAGSAKSRQGVPASNAQLGIMHDALSPMTSTSAHAALECRAETKINAPFDPDALQRFVRQMERRHPLLKMRLDADGQVHTDGNPVNIVEGTADTLLNIAEGEMARVSYALEGEVVALAVRMHRTVGDQTSAEILLDELRQMIMGKPLAKPLPWRKIAQALEAARHDPEDAASQRDQAFFWYAVTSDHGPAVPFARRSRALLPPLLGRNHGTAGVIPVNVPDGVTSSELMVSFAKALRGATATEGAVMMGRRVSTRSRLHVETAIGPFEVEQPVMVPANPADAAAMAQFRRVMAAFDGHRKFDSHAAAREFAESFKAWGNTPFQILFEELSQLPEGAPETLLHDVWLQVAPGKDGKAVRLVYDQDVVDAQTAQSIADGLMQPHKQLDAVN